VLGYISGFLQEFTTWLAKDGNLGKLMSVFDWILKNKLVEMTTGKTIPEWATTIIGYLTDIATAVMLISGWKTAGNVASTATGVAAGGGVNILKNVGASAAATASAITSGLAGLGGGLALGLSPIALGVAAGYVVDKIEEADAKAYYERFGRERGASTEDMTGVQYDEELMTVIAQYLEEMKTFWANPMQYDGNALDLYEQYYDYNDQFNAFTRMIEWLNSHGQGDWTMQDIFPDYQGEAGKESGKQVDITITMDKQVVGHIVAPIVSQ